MTESPESRQRRLNAYLDTIDRLEPDIAMIDHDAGIASIAISLKRIADALEKIGEAQQVRPDENTRSS